ncbi:MAG: phosphoenolpyruvate synthase [Clostridia bacterium]|nr:phosphoenolpyruvate synthase [Clostridia bacterium]
MLGSKIENLIRMKDAGLPVPDFTVLPFYALVPDRTRLDEAIDKTRGLPLAEQSRRLKQAAHDAAADTIPTPQDGLFAVRSSCSAEDSEDHSFAGQFDTFLEVPAADVPARAVDCVCSMFHENVLDYAHRAGINLRDLEMNVLVQRMVRSDVSGVLFTANPQGILNESVIIAGRGLGEGVVSDRVDTTAYYYNTTDRVYYADGKEELLDRETVEELIRLSETVCGLFGPYLDIEFAVEDGQIRLLQARPITTLSDAHPLIFDNSNIVESYPGLSLPLTVSFVHSVYAGVFESAGRRLLKNRDALEALRHVFGDTVGCANGRMYYKLSNWYEIINCLPLHKKFLPIWQEMVGVQYKDAFRAEVHMPAHQRAAVYVNTLWELLRAPHNMEKLHLKFSGIEQYVTEQFRRVLEPKEIFALYDLIEKRILSDWGLTLLNDTYAFLFTGLLKQRLKKKGAEYETKTNDYISGIANIESLRPIREMVRLACDKASLSDEEYALRKQAYIRQFGDRSLEELKLESETFRTSPQLLDQKIDEYTRDGEKLRQMAQSLKTSAPTLPKDPLTAFLSRRASTGIRHREKSRLNRSRIFGMVREAMLRLGETYTASGVLDTPRDIFYLTLPEARELADAPHPMQDTVSRRKAQYAVFERLPAYSRIVFSGREFDKNPRTVNRIDVRNDRDEMIGVPCSGGVAEGEACVVDDVRKATNLQDKILITKMTDPGWVFLLAAAKGVVSEKGSLLSHTAIISRELGIPAVVGIDGLMETVRTGDRVRLDGTSGMVQILQRASA